MGVTYQISDKRGDAILVVKSEFDDAETAESEFAKAAGLAGLGVAYENFLGLNPVATVPSITQLTRPQAEYPPAQEPWGQPPVQPYQAGPPMPAAAQAPAQGAPGPAPVCQHGTKLYRTGTSATNGREWKAWFCPAPGTDPTQCKKEWLR